MAQSPDHDRDMLLTKTRLVRKISTRQLFRFCRELWEKGKDRYFLSAKQLRKAQRHHVDHAGERKNPQLGKAVLFSRVYT